MPKYHADIELGLNMAPNTTMAVRRWDLFEKWLNPTSMDKAELELIDAWWVTPEQRNANKREPQ